MSWSAGVRSACRPGREPEGDASHRRIRAGMFSLVGIGLAITGHHLASGHPVSWPAAALGAALLFLKVSVHDPSPPACAPPT